MGIYLYRIEKKYVHKSQIRKRKFENKWLKLEKNGNVTIKGTYKKGYAWDGCSPKWKFRDICFGTPEGVLNETTGMSKTYYASMVHDIFYQFSPDLKSLITRKEVDDEFYLILKKNKFKSALVYYWAVRFVGWLYWGGKLIRIVIFIILIALILLRLM